MSVHTCREFTRRGRKPMPLDKRIPDRLPPDPKIVLHSSDLDGKITEAKSLLQQAQARTKTIKTNQEHDDVWNIIFAARKLLKSLTAQRQAIAILKATQAQPVVA